MATYIKCDSIPAGGEYDFYGRRYAVYDSEITIYSIAGDEALIDCKINTFNSFISSLSWSHPSLGNYLSASCGLLIYIWKESSPSNWELIHTNKSHSDLVTSIAWSPAALGLNLLTGSRDRHFSLIYCRSEDLWKNTINLAHNSAILSVSWLYHEKVKTFVTAAENIKVWEFRDYGFENTATIEQSFLDVKACSFGSIIAGCSPEGVSIYHKEVNWKETKVENARGAILKWSSYGNTLLVSSEECLYVIRRVPADTPTWIVAQSIGQDGKIHFGLININ